MKTKATTKQDSTQKLMSELNSVEKELALLKYIASLLHWDKSVIMPKKAFEQRANQEAYVSVKFYSLFTSEKLINLLKELSKKEVYNKLSDFDRKKVDFYNYRLKKIINVPKAHIEEYMKLLSISHHEWEEARKKESYEGFAPWLKKIYDMKKIEAKYIDPKENAYNLFLDDYEPGITVADIDALFLKLKPALIEIINKVKSSPNYKKINSKYLTDFGTFPAETQQEVCRDIAQRIIFDKDRFVISNSTHPFMISISKDDVRVTTGVRDDPLFSFGSTSHESGHALYESNFGPKVVDTIFTMDGFISLGLHESQSRFWENMICLSESFWKGYYPYYTSKFPFLKKVPFTDFYRMINITEPSFVRIEADELTYSLHVIIRYEIEKGLLDGTLKTEDLEKIWNQKYKEYLGITPEKPSRGVIQDVHWCNGLIGYFPTYVLGSIYSVMIYNAMKRDRPELEKDIEKLDFTFIRGWLKEKIHQYGALRTSKQIIKDSCGKDLDAQDFIDYLKNKYYRIYGIKE